MLSSSAAVSRMPAAPKSLRRYEGVLGDASTARRARLPARMRGLGLRSLEEVAPAAFCACFVEAAERFLDRSTPGGGSERGFF